VETAPVELFILLPLILVLPVTFLIRRHVANRIARVVASDEGPTQRDLDSLLFWKKVLDKAVVASFAVVIGMVLWGILGQL
jgi:hypothetical protein